jgi:CheY-like chemotaxis protein
LQHSAAFFRYSESIPICPASDLNYSKPEWNWSHVIPLDLNLPKMDGREVLAILKNDIDLKAIPIIVLTASDARADILLLRSLRELLHQKAE